MEVGGGAGCQGAVDTGSQRHPEEEDTQLGRQRPIIPEPNFKKNSLENFLRSQVNSL